DLGPLLVAWGLAIVVLVVEHELGASLLVFGFTLMMLYAATERASWVVLGMVLFIGGCLLAYQLFPHVQNRVANWIDPFDPEVYARNGGGLQIAQSLFGLGSGGIFGT